jgi:hypothetical protein
MDFRKVTPDTINYVNNFVVLISKNDARSLVNGSLRAFLSKIVDTPVNGLLSLFCIDSGH